MESKPSELVESNSAPAKAEATLTNPYPIEDRTAEPIGEKEKELHYVTGFKLYTVLLSVTLVAFLVMLDQTIVSTAIPKISKQFNSLKDIGKSSFAIRFARG